MDTLPKKQLFTILVDVVWILWTLKWMWLCSIFPIKGVVYDRSCFGNCNCCKNNTCHTVDGWPNVCTDGCIGRHVGARCYVLCTYDCVSCPSNIHICTECNEGFYLGLQKDCTSKCPSNCTACISNTRCTACKDGYDNKDGSTTCPYTCPANCECRDNVCVACNDGFYDADNLCTKECPHSCLTCTSTEECSVCKNGFYNGHKFDNDAASLFSDCALNCRDDCTKCLSYDSCVQCIDGKYGQECNKDCSNGCRNQTCNIVSGNCVCSADFVGDKCIECVNRKYVANCDKICPANCKGKKCERNSGVCSDGCEGNFKVLDP